MIIRRGKSRSGKMLVVFAVLWITLASCSVLVCLMPTVKAASFTGLLTDNHNSWHSIEVVDDMPINITVTWDSSSDDLNIYLYDKSGDLVASSTSITGTSESISHDHSIWTGTYWLKVEGENIISSSSIEYSGTCNFQISAAISNSFGGSLSDKNNVWYSIEVDEDMPVDISLSWDDSSDDLNIYLYDRNGRLAASSIGSTGLSESITYDHSIWTGTYRLKVEGESVTSSSTIQYTGTCNFQISLVASNTFEGTLSNNNNIWYSIDVDNDMPLDVTVSWDSPSDDINIYLYETTFGDLEASSTSSTGTSESITHDHSSWEDSFWLKIEGKHITSSSSIQYSGTCNFPIQISSTSSNSYEGSLSNKHNVWHSIEIDNDMPLDVTVSWGSSSDDLNIYLYEATFGDLEASSTSGTGASESITYDLSGYEDLFWLKIEGKHITSSSSILYTVNCNYQIAEPVSYPFENEISDKDEISYTIKVDKEMPLDIVVSWNDASDNLDIYLYNELDEEISYSMSNTGTSESITFETYSETCTLKIFGTEVASSNSIDFFGSCNYPLSTPPTVKLISPLNTADYGDITFIWETYDAEDDIRSNTLYIDHDDNPFDYPLITKQALKEEQYVITQDELATGRYSWGVEVSDSVQSVYSEIGFITIAGNELEITFNENLEIHYYIKTMESRLWLNQDTFFGTIWSSEVVTNKEKYDQGSYTIIECDIDYKYVINNELSNLFYTTEAGEGTWVLINDFSSINVDVYTLNLPSDAEDISSSLELHDGNILIGHDLNEIIETSFSSPSYTEIYEAAMKEEPILFLAIIGILGFIGLIAWLSQRPKEKIQYDKHPRGEVANLLRIYAIVIPVFILIMILFIFSINIFTLLISIVILTIVIISTVSMAYDTEKHWEPFHLPGMGILYFGFLGSVVLGYGVLYRALYNPALGLLIYPIAFVIAFSFPPLMWLSYVYRRNAPFLLSRRVVFPAIAWGILVSILVLALSNWSTILYLPSVLSVIALAPIVEELCKPLGLLFVRDKIRSEFDGLVLGVAIGVGFAIIENAIYAVSMVMFCSFSQLLSIVLT